MSMTPPQDISSLLSLHDPFPNLSDVILDSDIFTRSVDINDSYSLSQSTVVGGLQPVDFGGKGSSQGGSGGGGLGEFLLPDMQPPTHQHLGFTNWNLDSSSNSKIYRGGTPEGLESIPEYDASQSVGSLLYPSSLLHHPQVPTGGPLYNISFPTTLQPRDHKFILEDKAGDARRQPGDSSSILKGTNYQEQPQEHEDPRSVKSNKRSRRSTPNGSTSSDLAEPSEDQDGPYVSEERRIRKKCFTSLPNFSFSSQPSTENRRRDSIKQGLDELQRALPHLGSPEEEKISQASILFEAGKYIKDSQSYNNNMEDKIHDLKSEIEQLNREIEHSQSELPENGVVLVPKVLASRSLADRFHDHVVEKTIEDWRYWVFTNIMGHFVHSFDREVDASSIGTLRETNALWISKNMSLHQLRKDAYRKLAKLCAKTSIVDDPSKLPEEALGFVTNRERVINTITETVPDKPSIKR